MTGEFYLTVANSVAAEISIERSRFIGHCREVASEADAKSFIAQIRVEHAQATHNCYAYRIGNGESPIEYFNDHGEPNGTAGKPILGAIQRLKLTNVVVVVTRYFGGKKLGVRGLIEAYGGAATQVLEQAGSIRRVPKFTIVLSYPYHDHQNVLYRLNQFEAEVIANQFSEVVCSEFLVPLNYYEALMAALQALPELKILNKNL
jgi:uncharacterized YigZ family protein